MNRKLLPVLASTVLLVFLTITFNGSAEKPVLSSWPEFSNAVIAKFQKSDAIKRRLLETSEISAEFKVFVPFRNSPVARKQKGILVEEGLGIVVQNTTEEQLQFLQTNSCVEGAADRFQSLANSDQSHLAEELWKYCSLWYHGGMYIDAESQLLKASALKSYLVNSEFNGIAVMMDSFVSNSIDGSLIMLREPHSKVAAGMAALIVNTAISELITSPLLLPRTLYDLIQDEIPDEGVNSKSHWYMLSQSCSESPFHKHSELSHDQHSLYTCSRSNGLCCFVYTGNDSDRVAILASRNPILPLQKIALSDIPKPILQQSGNGTQQLTSIKNEDLPFIATLQRLNQNQTAAVEQQQQMTQFKTFYEQLKDKKCLPSHSCNKCLADKKHGATCETCLEACPCYCKAMCEEVDMGSSTAHILQYDEVLVSKPSFSQDPTRLIPRIVHQTWFEGLDPEKYPNMSRLTESFKRSGWEYHFYTDDAAGEFLSEHFPPQVRQAYDALVPGAFKADLFRYCCLLVYGGVYADVDTMTGPSLDAAVPPDAGFMVGLDEPGKKLDKRMCLWNGFIAAAPGHPFLARAIESVVNNIHQRFTSVDVARMHCPLPEMSIITSFAPLFVAGPCMLGSTINSLLGRHRQTTFKAGELSSANSTVQIPGRTILLQQNKIDMGAHRFTSVEPNLIVLSTDFPDSDDREKLEDYEHYSETRIRFETYGIDGVYRDNHRDTTALIRMKFE